MIINKWGIYRIDSQFGKAVEEFRKIDSMLFEHKAARMLKHNCLTC